MTDQEQRAAAIDELYARLHDAERRLGSRRRLADCTGRDRWPAAGVYFFFEPGEHREDGATPRVVRVGTHALTATSRTSLWTRLRAHRGSVGGRNPGGGNHRGSIFRLHVGTAILSRGGHAEAASTWGKGGSAPRAIREREVELEREVSRYIGSMSLIAIDVPDRFDRAALERTCIALLSNAEREPIDPPSRSWLGHHADRAAVRRSGLWNVQHVDESPDSIDALDLIR